MKIFLTFEYPLEKIGYGGGHQILLGFARALQLAGDDVSIVASGRDEIGARSLLNGCTFYLTGISINRFLFNPFIVGIYALWLIAINRPSVVIGFGGESLFVSILCRILNIKFFPYLASPYLPKFNNYKAIRKHANLYLQYLSTRNAAKVLTLSDYLTKQAASIWSINISDIVKIGSGIHNDFIEKGMTSVSNSKKTTSFNILTIGRIEFAQKPIDQVFEAISHLTSRIERWSIIGTGPDLNLLQTKVKSLGLSEKVKFYGTLNSKEIHGHLQWADIVILPSNHESLMLTAYEAISQGRITILNDVADLKRDFSAFASVLIQDGTGDDDYKESIVYAMNNYECLNKCTVSSANFVRNQMEWTFRIKCFHDMVFDLHN